MPGKGCVCMILDHECVRSVLLEVEKCGMQERITFRLLCDRLPDYPTDTIWYTCLKLDEGGFLDIITASQLRMVMPSVVEVKCLTYQGHEFLDTIRENGTWAKVKDTAKKAGVFSLESLGKIAQGVATAAITAALQQSQ